MGIKPHSLIKGIQSFPVLPTPRRRIAFEHGCYRILGMPLCQGRGIFHKLCALGGTTQL